MRKRNAVFIAVVSIGFWFGLSSAWAQDKSKDESQKETLKQPPSVQPVEPYRLDFSFNELADGKIVNTRHYSLNLTTNDSNEIKIGTRVPVLTGAPVGPGGNTQFEYIDLGTNIWAQVREHGDELVLAVRSEVSNLDMNSDSGHGKDLPPVVRQIKLSGATLLVLGKPIIIGSMDDPSSKRQFQLEVTVTKLR
jgi:hypothetical protein